MKPQKLTTTIFLAILASLLLSGSGKCYGQDTTAQKAISFPLNRNILIVESTQTKAWSPPRPGLFRVRYKVKVVSGDSGTVDMGNIQYISDSSLFLNGKEIKMSEIVSIKKSRGKTTTIVSGSVFGASVLTFALLVNYYNNKQYPYDYEGSGGLGPQLGTLFLGLVSGATTLVGVVQMATVKKYKMDKGKWKFDVKQDIFSDPGIKHSPKPFQKKIKDKDK